MDRKSKDHAPARADASGSPEPIAIIGIGCRFPGGGDSPESLWQMLRDGVDAVSDIPAERAELRALYDPVPGAPGKIASPRGGFLANLDQFDPSFFGISPREATYVDPQQRLLLETAWEAFEDAGLPPDRLKGTSVGIFIGMWTNDYEDRMFEATSDIDLYMTTGGGRYSASGRLSYAFDFHGPSLTVDTACSSSLVTIHLACQSLRSGESVVALAGGVNLILKPWISIGYSRSGMLSPDGRCKFGDASGNGYVRSEGVGVVLLKPLARALAEGDRIYALVRGSAVNNDGQSSGLLVAPGVEAQQAMLREAYRSAGVDPAAVQYLEAHGTGTGVGDPVELEALGAVLGQGRPTDRPCRVGSIKTNIGHTEAASGIAGLIKAALCLRHRQIPKSLHFNVPNPKIPWSTLGIEVQRELGPWPAAHGPAFAGVNSFGVTGTNAHVVLEEAPAAAVPAVTPATPERPVHLLCVSAKTEAALRDLALAFDHQLAEEQDALSDLCFSAATCRTQFASRLAVVGASAEEMREKLQAFAATGREIGGVAAGQIGGSGSPRVAFLFTGQGAQYVQMGRRLFETQPAFRRALLRCDEILRAELPHPLLSVLHPDPTSGDGRLDQTAFTQPALFALEYALAEMWRSWGIEPGCSLGHSVGEYVAACVAGVFSLEDGLRLIAARGRLMQGLSAEGKMAAVFAAEETVTAAIAPFVDAVSIAALNGPESIVVSGAAAAVDGLMARLATAGIKTKPLVVSHAFHSPLMEPMLDEFARTASALCFSAPRMPLVSNVTGGLFAKGQVVGASYWRAHARGAVRFADGIRALHEHGARVFLEIGPSPTLSGMAMRCLPEDRGAVFLPSLRQGHDDWESVLGTLGALYVRGVEPDWCRFEGGYARRRVSLPRHPFQRERFWIDGARHSPSFEPASPAAPSGGHPLLGRRLRSALKATLFESRVDARALPLLDDHRIHGTAVFPAAGYLEIALAAAATKFGEGPYLVRDLSILHPLALADEHSRTLQIILTPQDGGATSLEIFSADDQDGAEWTRHLSAVLASASATNECPAAPGEAPAAIQARCVGATSGAAFYDTRQELGASVGPRLRALEQLWRRDGEALARLRLPDECAADASAYRLHPALLDASIQLLIAALPGPGAMYLPVGLDRFSLANRAAAPVVWVHAEVSSRLEADREAYSGDLRLLDGDGSVVAELKGLHLTRAGVKALRQLTQQGRVEDWLYGVAWRPQPLPPRSQGATGGGAWLILADRGGVGAALASRLQEQGARCLVAWVGARGETDGRTVIPDDPSDFHKLVADLPGPLAGIVYLWGLDAPEPVAGESLEPVQRLTCGSLLHLVQALSAAAPEGGPGRTPLVLVTRGAQPVGSDLATLAIAQAPLLGMARTLALEHPEWRCRRVDLDPAQPGVTQVQSLLEAIRTDEDEDESAVRAGLRHVPRLVRRVGADRLPIPADQPFQLEKPRDGVLDHLWCAPAPRRPPAPGEVEIEVQATGLNFRDVLNAMGMDLGVAGPLGLECAGRISAVGDGVSGLAVGDAVLAMAFGSFRSSVTTPAALVVKKPSHLSFAEAAGIPVTFLTAHYGLDHLARIKSGDRVLIHAAAGGLGLSALQLAQAAGAEVFATAGSPEKRAFLHSLGIRHVFSSRSLDFAAEVRRATGGQGVDVVLNSLSGEFIEHSVALLSAKGHFLEVGKRGIWSAAQVAAVKPEAAYSVIALDQMAVQSPELVGRLLREIVGRFERQALRPLPLRRFDFSEAKDAFRYMAQGRNIGKVVVVHGYRCELQADATYLITGGLGGLGLRVAERFVESGARHVVLVGRRAPSEAERSAVARLEQRGARVVIAAADVSRAADMGRIREQMAGAKLPPLRGIVHAAGVLADGVVLQQDWGRFATVMGAKLDGAWNLNAWAQEPGLDFMLLFSSVASLLGSKGQSNHAAANAFLDALAHRRSAQGLKTLSLNWGPWADVGLAAALDGRGLHHWTSQGIRPIAPEQGTEALMRLIGEGSGQIGVLPVNWATYAAARPSEVGPFLSELIGNAQRGGRESVCPPPAAALTDVLATTPAEKRAGALLAHIREQAARILGLPASRRLDTARPLKELGLDSLMAVALRNALGTSFGRTLPGTLIFDYPSIQAISDFVANQLFGSGSLAEAPSPERAQAAREQAEAVRQVQALSEEEAETLLTEKLAALAERGLS